MPNNTFNDKSTAAVQPGLGQGEEARSFLSLLFAQAPAGSRVLIWTLPEKRSFWCGSVEAAVQVVENLRGKSNVYYGIGVSGKDYGATNRCPASEVIAIPGLWADFDIAGPAHKKTNLPPNREAILELMQEAGLPPSISINSGHGLQSYWLFEDLWELTSDEDRANAETLVRRWNYTLRDLARKKGWDVDSTFDLARVYRVPGTMNRKVENHPVPVEIIHADGPTYKPADFQPYLLEEDPSSTLRHSKAKDYQGIQVAEDLTLDPSAVADIELLELLCEADPKFAASWNRKRKDLTDDSGSSYDMSLANIAASAGWSDQQIVNLLIHHRRKHKDDLKLRLNYYRLTLFKARQAVAKDQAIECLNEMLHEEPEAVDHLDLKPVPDEEDDLRGDPNEASEPGMPAEPKANMKRQAILRHVSDLLGMDITRIVKYTTAEPTYRLETSGRSIDLGNVNGLIRQEALRSKIAALVGHLIPPFRTQLWSTVAQSLLNACEECSVGDAASPQEITLARLREYVKGGGYELVALKELTVESVDDCTFIYKGRIHVRLHDVAKHLRMSGEPGLKDMELARRMLEAGCEDVNRWPKKPEGGQTKRSFYMLPPDFEY